jgi:hypothetical protein
MPTSKVIRVSKLGVGGVSLTKSPLKMDDHEVASAQNAEPYADRGRMGVRKRPAYRPVNTIATGPIQGVLSVELAQGLAGAPTPVPGKHPPGITSPGPGNPDRDDDWDPTDPGTDGAPPFIPPTDIPPGPIVVVARNGYPRNASWKYTQDGGVTWYQTDAFSHGLASDDVDPGPPPTPFTLTLQDPIVGISDVVGVFMPVTLTGMELIPNLGGTYTVEFDFLATLTIGPPGGETLGSGWILSDGVTDILAENGIGGLTSNATYGPDGWLYPHRTLTSTTWAGLQAFQAGMQFIFSVTAPGITVTLHTIEITNATWSQP